jgi:hypothetical protein
MNTAIGDDATHGVAATLIVFLCEVSSKIGVAQVLVSLQMLLYLETVGQTVEVTQPLCTRWVNHLITSTQITGSTIGKAGQE